MRYQNNIKIRVGDLVQLADGRTAEIVAVLDSGVFSKAYPKKHWQLFSSGVLVKLEDSSVLHVPNPNLNLNFLEHPMKSGKLTRWWRRPNRPGDRLTSGLLGVWAGMWIGGLGRVIYETPVSIAEIVVYAFSAGVLMFMLGIAFPKASRFVTIPFVFFGAGSGST